MCGLNKERSCKINKLTDKKEGASINSSFTSKCRYQLVVRLKTI